MTVRSLALVLSALAVLGCSSRDKPAQTAPAAAPAATEAAAAPTDAPASTGTDTMALQKTDLAPGNGGSRQCQRLGQQRRGEGEEQDGRASAADEASGESTAKTSRDNARAFMGIPGIR